MAKLGKRAGVDIKNVLTINLSSKATTANAMLGGWGKCKRVIISDTLVQRYSWDEIIVLQPLLNWGKRGIELAADKAALELSSNPHGFVSLITKLTDQNLTDAEPSRWTKVLFYDHRTYNERVRLAHDYDCHCSELWLREQRRRGEAI